LAMSTWPAVPTDVIKIVLKKYLEKGIQEFPINADRSLKLLNVKFLGNNVGGNTNSSSNGLNALDAVIIKGYAENTPNKASNMNNAISPPKERLSLFLFLMRRCILNFCIACILFTHPS